MEKQFIVKSSLDLKNELHQKYKAVRQRLDEAGIKARYKQIELEKEKRKIEKLAELAKKERDRKKLEDEIVRKFKIHRDYLLLNTLSSSDQISPRQVESEIQFWKQAQKYIRGQSIPDSIRRIVAEVCLKHDQYLLDIESDRRTTDVMPARFEMIYRLRTETTWSLPRIGRFLGNRDHTTILHGYQKFKKQLENGEVSL
jgi:chromosomal replication initiation ATPase DnaA